MVIYLADSVFILLAVGDNHRPHSLIHETLPTGNIPITSFFSHVAAGINE